MRKEEEGRESNKTVVVEEVRKRLENLVSLKPFSLFFEDICKWLMWS